MQYWWRWGIKLRGQYGDDEGKMIIKHKNEWNGYASKRVKSVKTTQSENHYQNGQNSSKASENHFIKGKNQSNRVIFTFFKRSQRTNETK